MTDDPSQASGSPESVRRYAQELERRRYDVAHATEALEALRRHGRGPIGSPGCCREWEWMDDLLGSGWRWQGIIICRRDGSPPCDHAHHADDDQVVIG